MAVAQGLRPVFCYAYRPLLRAQGMDDGGFTVTLMENGLLLFDVYAADRRIVSELSFAVPTKIVTRYQQDVRRAAWWLKCFPLHMAAGAQAQFASMVGLDGWAQPFRMDDLPELVNCPFGTERGHYARMMYNLLEDVAGLLAGCGIDLKLDSFGWDANRIRPMEEPVQQMYG